MNRRNHSGAGLFLMEMIAAICGFILCASVCILAFAKADRMSRLAKDRGEAVSAAQTAAEIWKAEGVDGLQLRMHAVFAEQETAPEQETLSEQKTVTEQEALSEQEMVLEQETFPEQADASGADGNAANLAGGDQYVILWDRDWEILDGDSGQGDGTARYEGILQIREGDDGMSELHVSVGYTGGQETEPLFELDAARYVRP